MIRALYTASTGMHAQQLNMDTIAHNLSNVNTTGFKKSGLVFQDLLYQKLPVGDVANAPSTLQIGNGVRVTASVRDFSASGGLIATDRHLDVALQGNGFFAIRTPGGEAYTRNGSFHVSGNMLVTASGHPVLDANRNTINTRNATDIYITDEGSVYGYTGGSDQATLLGRIGIAQIANPGALEAMGDGLYGRPAQPPQLAAPGQAGRGMLVNGFLEMSNVKVVEEMVNLITAQRAYEISSKAIQASDEMLAQASNLRR